ncbi:pyruvate formate-lyase-activating protein [Streptomyces sp. NPDC002812]|uniref:pyruvate formate-lyase-activating protein n=1 Tax=unclassified Streptomyces TaxID=2593676 RepID=UPI00202E6CE4|nr:MULTISPECIES: pyruvate formate-lyase-activating protein [unclassified Streptomyces]MCM1965020.1 pyruvate formate-lyase-activating protein [Streptomyces sp. G1]MCX5124736.1 pyruvate formate-lyase-activating protein [Streptomyces sp. NBC_00347]MCX5297916.1 pyruvate formate-lyase-activating protein [Streptomyces sp. NBC_00193]
MTVLFGTSLPVGHANAISVSAGQTPAAAATQRPSEGTVHSWDLSTGVDGPGTRFVTFLSGCPLTCLYCHNPDTMRMRNGKRTSADDVIAEARKYTKFIAASGGGATISGGEPLLQPVFAGELLHRMKNDLGLHTALDTSGFLGTRATDALLRDVDLVLLDIKSWDRETYKKVTGRPLEPTLDFARRLADLGKEVHLRFVLVPGLTDARENIEGVAAFAGTLGNISRVDVLPFHKLGESKWEALDMKFTLHDTPSPTAGQVAEAKAIFAAQGLNAV